MVDKEIIKKTFNKIILKHGMFFQHIRECLREVTDNKMEYELLRDDIWEFMEATKNSANEQMIVKGNDGSSFKNKKGTVNSVHIPDGVKEFFESGGEILYTIHNHPYKDNASSCFQSEQDFSLMHSYDVKYSVTIGKDGFMITKNNHSGANFVSNIYDSIYTKLLDEFHKEYDGQIKELKQKYDVNNKNYSELEDYKGEINVLLNEHLTKNVGKYVKELDDMFISQKKEFDKIDDKFWKGDCRCWYVPRSYSK